MSADVSTPTPRSRSERPLPAAKLPRSTGGIAALGILLALLATAVGVLAVRDALAYGGVLRSEPLLHPLANTLQGLRPGAWTVVLGVVLALVGLALLVKALRPSAPKVVPVVARSGVFLRPRDVSRLVETAVEGVDGVLGVRSSATPRRVSLAIRSTGEEGVAERVREVATDRLQPLAKQPTVHIRTEGANR